MTASDFHDLSLRAPRVRVDLAVVTDIKLAVRAELFPPLFDSHDSLPVTHLPISAADIPKDTFAVPSSTAGARTLSF